MKRKDRIHGRGPAIVSAGIAHFVCAILLLAICHAAEGGSNDGSSNDSSRSQSQDYDDVVNDDAADVDAWQADDPYMPTDDYFLLSMKSEIEAEHQAEVEAEYNEKRGREESMHKALMDVVGGSAGILGLASAVFCTSMFLYFLKVQNLMRQYERQGDIVEGRILASYPDIDEATKKANAIEHPDKIQNNESYSMMTDDESYQIGSRSGLSGSDGSGANDIEDGQKIYNMDEKEHSHRVIIGNSLAGGSLQTSTAKSRQQIYNANEKISENKRKFLSQSFHVIVEYDDITYHDVINQESSKIIRKRLLVMGEDIDERINKSNLLVKLHVLQKLPMSGYPCGEVHRALRWQKILSFNVYIMLGASLVIGGGVVASHILSTKFLCGYMVLLVLQVPLLNCFLQRSFSEIISKEYLENGSTLSSESSEKHFDKEHMISALKHGTSFGCV